MVNVIAWPPFGLTAWELDEQFPQSRSVGLIGGRARTSSALRSRRVGRAIVAGIGPNQAGAGYVRMLKRQWGGAPRLVRVECWRTLPLRAPGVNLRNTALEWTDGGVDLLWSSGGVDLLWGDGAYNLYGVPVTSGGFYGLTVTGLPASQIVARPSDRITVTDGTTTEEGLALNVVTSDASGAATIRTDRTSAFTLSGQVSIGDPESIVFEALDEPREMQPLEGSWGYTWEFREVFSDEYADGFTEVDPWL